MASATLAVTLSWGALLPSDSTVIEHATLPGPARDRAIVLWMIAPTASECPSASDWPTSCRDPTHSCFWRGRTRLSLIDTNASRVLNTIAIDDPMTGDDSFDVPRILRGWSPYRVRNGAPRLLHVADYNGDGERLEVAFFQAESCSLLFTALIGYSVAGDRLIHYPVRQYRPDPDVNQGAEATWPDQLFAVRPLRPGVWQYDLVAPGNYPSLTCITRYLPAEEAFEERCRLKQ